ncbi:DNA-processing protein DprA [Deinococcus cellulosilyticus]|uniref:Smf/DprA SLOG domain-containing protein n=1 Tax=Deinococcus cellulosilyticus (strain DSM 18568 / NBRC 106333 / KACC 11606 / 5516J-15) TaxID=1223518 RepID=A0A511N1K4_DEIC1|nr:DNA-processing protein DprA [Deinococcus cellulosilyticus]GEM46226.1 hypothetical protein DC3_18610 [Deinococcus cellulosilyticus NBRC 106333 = KACC 11606]
MSRPVSPSTLNILTLLALPKVGQQTVKKVLQHKSLQEVHDLTAVGFLDPRLYQALSDAAVVQQAQEEANKIEENLKRLDLSAIGFDDPEYPATLKPTPDAPLVLYVRGELPGDLHWLGVVGTRSPTPHGALTAQRISRHFAEEGFGILAGLMPGCATLALQSAVEASAYSMALLPAGLDQPFAPALKQLSDQMLKQGGVLMSPFAPGTVLRNHQQALRDRMLAGLSRGLLVVQSGTDGTSLHPMRSALRLGRPVAVPALSQKDLQEQHPVTQVNRLLLSRDPQASQVLEVPQAELEQVLLLHSKDDYQVFEEAMQKP